MNRNHHLVLLGDSVFDNARYVQPGEPDVGLQVCQLSDGNVVTNLARDGAVTRDVAKQILKLPTDATHLVVSVGGNDALQHSSIGFSPDWLERLVVIKNQFRRHYQDMLDGVLAFGLPTAICTIYRCDFADKYMRQVADVGISIFNDVITYEASARSLDLIDLRPLLTDRKDYSCQIEPSMFGGEKIAQAINQWRTND